MTGHDEHSHDGEGRHPDPPAHEHSDTSAEDAPNQHHEHAERRTFEHRGHTVEAPREPRAPERVQHAPQDQVPPPHEHAVELVIDGKQIPVMAHEGRFMTHLFPWKFYDDLDDLARDLIDLHEQAITEPPAEDDGDDAAGA